MSGVNMKRLVENIRSGTNVYTPLTEIVVNAIQAIDQKGENKGLVQIEILRSRQEDMIDNIKGVDGFVVTDNGSGFNQTNRDAFDLLYTENKIADGGKGFGRFTCLKYFETMSIYSTFADGDGHYVRTFEMGLNTDIIINEEKRPSEASTTGSVVKISGIKNVKFADKKVDTISRVLVERLLPYFMNSEYRCPNISIRDRDGDVQPVLLNRYLGTEGSQIVEIPTENGNFSLGTGEDKQNFTVRIFKFYSPRGKSKISLVAHRREVTETLLQSRVPEFEEEFFEKTDEDGEAKGRNFIIKAYVFSEYLNDNVSLERGEFIFQNESDLLSDVSQEQIEIKAAEIAKVAVGSEIQKRKVRKQARISEYVDSQAPWHRKLSTEVDFESLPMRPSNQEIEIHLQRRKFEREMSTRLQVSAILESDASVELSIKIDEVIESISETSKNDLIHYVSMRKCVLDLFAKSFEIGDDGKHKSEGDVHDIIMRRRSDTNQLDYHDHNLWILDERLNFAEYVSSDNPINGGSTDRTDITAFNKRIAFRGENESSNPITIFEFKKPQRDDFANPSSKDDPVRQISRYVNQIRKGKYKTPANRNIETSKTTPFYGYVVCDINEKVSEWLEMDHQFTLMPDGKGWFRWFPNNNLYMEVIGWDKLLRDAEMRNRIFFKELGIE